MVRQGKRPLRIWSTEAGAIPQFRKNSKGKDTSNVSKNVILNLDKFTGVFMSNKERDVKNGKITIPKVLDASDHGKTTIFNGKKIGNWVTSNFEGSNSIKKSPKPIFVFEPIILAYSSSLILALAAYNGGAQWHGQNLCKYKSSHQTNLCKRASVLKYYYADNIRENYNKNILLTQSEKKSQWFLMPFPHKKGNINQDGKIRCQLTTQLQGLQDNS